MPLKLNSYQRGGRYEKIVADMLNAKGFSAFRLSLFAPSGSDVQLAPNVQVEVKGSVLHKVNSQRIGFSFCIEKLGHTSAKDSRVLILLCEDAARHVFIIPTDLCNCNYITIPNASAAAYNGQWQPYLDNWPLLVQCGASHPNPATLTIGV